MIKEKGMTSKTFKASLSLCPHCGCMTKSKRWIENYNQASPVDEGDEICAKCGERK